MHDERHDRPSGIDNDDANWYVFGAIHGKGAPRNVVIAVLQSGRNGTVAAANLVQPMNGLSRT